MTVPDTPRGVLRKHPLHHQPYHQILHEVIFLRVLDRFRLLV